MLFDLETILSITVEERFSSFKTSDAIKFLTGKEMGSDFFELWPALRYYIFSNYPKLRIVHNGNYDEVLPGLKSELGDILLLSPMNSDFVRMYNENRISGEEVKKINLVMLFSDTILKNFLNDINTWYPELKVVRKPPYSLDGSFNRMFSIEHKDNLPIDYDFILYMFTWLGMNDCLSACAINIFDFNDKLVKPVMGPSRKR